MIKMKGGRNIAKQQFCSVSKFSTSAYWKTTEVYYTVFQKSLDETKTDCYVV